MSRWHKLSNKDRERIARNVVEYGLPTKYVAELYGVSQRHVQSLAREYRITGRVPLLKKPGRKKHRKYPEKLEALILLYHEKYKVGAVQIGKMIREKHGIAVDNNYIHNVLKVHGMAVDEPNKSVRKKPWVRYERKHSLSAVHMDWCYNPDTELWVGAVLDDASRYVLSIIETPHATAEASIKLLDDAYNRYSYLRPIQAVITDHGSQFTCNKPSQKDKRNKEKCKHKFEEYCHDKGIEHILAGVKHPQTNGKIERFFQTYKKFRWRFPTLDDFVTWYNTVRPHMSLDEKTPEKVFYERISDIVFGAFWEYAERQLQREVKLNEKETN